jgi:signal transduction histidine kinase
VARCLKTGRIETRFSTPDEDRFWGISTKAYAMPIKDRKGEITGAVECVTDVTDLRNMEAQLKQYAENLEEMVERRTRDLEKAQAELLEKERLAVLGHFSGSISHELRNPLAAIDLSAYLLNTMQVDPDEKTLKHVGRICNNVKKCTDIIQSLLSLSRMERPKTDKHDLGELIRETLDSCRIPNTVDVIVDLADNGVSVDVDRTQIRMALKNVVANAVQAMNEKGVLTVSVRRPEGENFQTWLDRQGEKAATHVEVCVSDNGPGISEKVIGKIFDPLFTTKTHGIGCGLSITQMIVENHGGIARAESTPGNGAAFILTLPCSTEKSLSAG